MKLEALTLSRPHRNHIASLFLKEHHWVIPYTLTGKTKAKWRHHDKHSKHSEMLNSMRGSPLTWLLPFHHLKSHRAQWMIGSRYPWAKSCIGSRDASHSFLKSSEKWSVFTLYAHHPYIPKVPKTRSGVFKHIVYWNDHRVNTLDLFWNEGNGEELQYIVGWPPSIPKHNPCFWLIRCGVIHTN